MYATTFDLPVLGLFYIWREKSKAITSTISALLDQSIFPRGSRYLIIKELGLKDHDYYGFCGLSPS